MELIFNKQILEKKDKDVVNFLIYDGNVFLGKNPLNYYDAIENTNFFDTKIEKYISDSLSKNSELPEGVLKIFAKNSIFEECQFKGIIWVDKKVIQFTKNPTTKVLFDILIAINKKLDTKNQINKKWKIYLPDNVFVKIKDYNHQKISKENLQLKLKSWNLFHKMTNSERKNFGLNKSYNFFMPKIKKEPWYMFWKKFFKTA